jgi:hypothetical protein
LRDFPSTIGFANAEFMWIDMSDSRGQQTMVIRGEPDPASASLADWVAYRNHLRGLAGKDENVSVALAVANAQTQKLQPSRHPVQSVCMH